MSGWLADTEAIARQTGRPAATIRWWAHKGWLQRKGTGRNGRALYDVEEAERLAAQRASLDTPPSSAPTSQCQRQSCARVIGPG